MEEFGFKLILKAVGYTLSVVLISYFFIGKLLVFAFGYFTVEASYHLPTHALLIGLIFTIIFCTLLILAEINSK